MSLRLGEYRGEAAQVAGGEEDWAPFTFCCIHFTKAFSNFVNQTMHDCDSESFNRSWFSGDTLSLLRSWQEEL